MNKNVFVVGFMLFAIFFGAGNLIFPPKLGAESGLDFWASLSGFVLTGVGLPLLGIIVAAFYKGGYKEVLKKVSPAFSLVFLTAIYLAIGPFFGGPRTAATAYDIAVKPFISGDNMIPQIIFCLIYFAIVLWLSLNPSQMIDRVGAILTPVLLVSLIGLIIRVYFLLQGSEPLAAKPIESPFFNGVIEGYFTLDALAAVAFSVVVLTAIKEKSTPGASLAKQTIYAGLIAAFFLAVIYVALGWIGNHLAFSVEEGQNLGTQILNVSANTAFGEVGRIILGVIVTLACLTTAIGICAAASEYLNDVFPRISYEAYVYAFVLVSFTIANIGLDAVISKSVPVLLILYPITMTVVLMLLINLFTNIPIASYRFALGFVTIISILSVLGKGHLELLDKLPLKSYSMEWILFSLAGIVAGYVWKIVTPGESAVLTRD